MIQSSKTPPSPCPNEDELRAFTLGKLSREKIDQLGSHIALCPLCETHIEKLHDESDTIIDCLRAEETPSTLDDEFHGLEYRAKRINIAE